MIRGVAEVDRAALAVGEAAVVQHLQEHVEHVGVRLLDFVEQDDLVGPATHAFGEGFRPRRSPHSREERRSSARRWSASLHVLGHVDAGDRRASSANRNSARALVSSVLPTPVGPRNRKLPMGRAGSCSPARALRTASDTAASASSWPTTRRAQEASSIWKQLLALALQHLVHGHAGPAGDDGGDLPRRPPPRRPSGLAFARALGLGQLRFDRERNFGRRGSR